MGNQNCCVEKYVTDNTYENLIMEITLKLKIRNFKISEIKNLLENIFTKEIIKENENFKEIIYLTEENYLKLIKNYFVESDIKENPYYILQLNLFPKFEDFLKNSPKIFILKESLGFCAINELDEILENLNLIKNVNSLEKCEINIEEFFIFIKDLMAKILIEIPNKVLSTLDLLLNLDLKNFEKIESRYLGNIEKKDLQDFYENQDQMNLKHFLIFDKFKINKEYAYNFQMYIQDSIKIENMDYIFNRLKWDADFNMTNWNVEHNNNSESGNVLKKEDIGRFNIEYSWLWDAFTLRQYYLNKFN